MFLKTFWIATRVAITNIFAIIIIKLFWGRIKWQLLRCTFGTRDCLTMTVLLAGWVALLCPSIHPCQPCHPCSGIKLVKAVPQEAQLPHLPPGQPGGTLASGFQQPGGYLFHNYVIRLMHDDDDDCKTQKPKVRSSELSGDAVETKNLLRSVKIPGL